MKNGLIIDEHGTKKWYKDDLLHRVDGPAMEFANGNKFWLIEDKLHRVDGPAIEYADGDKFWCIEDNCHRVDGPAIERANGDKEWYYQHQKIECSSQQEFEKLIKLLAFI